MDWYKRYPKDFLEGTAHMTCEQVGIYSRLLDHQWCKGRLFRDRRQLAALCGTTPARFERAWAAVLADKFELDEDGYFNPRMADTAEQAERISEAKSRGGRAPRRQLKRTDVEHVLNGSSNIKASTHARARRASESSSLSPSGSSLGGGEGGAAFDEFWAAYPRKVKKLDAEKAWKQMASSRPPTEQIVAKVHALSSSRQWTEEGGRYIPHPASWLRAGGWDDEVEVVTAKPGTTREDFGRRPPKPEVRIEADHAAIEEWEAIKAELADELDPQVFETWLEPTTGVRHSGSVLVVAAPTEAHQGYLPKLVGARAVRFEVATVVQDRRAS